MNTMTESTNIRQRQRQKRVSFPYISIGYAIKNAEKLKAYKGSGLISIRDALIKMGYTPTSSSADRALSAMVRSYGLLDQQGTKGSNGTVQLTALAKKILLLSEDSEERKEAISQAVIKDELMQKVFDKWPRSDEIPKRDEIISELQLDPRFDEFTQDAAVRFATVIQETFEFLNLSKHDGADVHEESNKQGDEKKLTKFSGRHDKTPPPPNKQTGLDEYKLTLSKTKEIRLYISESLTKDDIEFMMSWIKRLDLEKANMEANQDVDKNAQE